MTYKEKIAEVCPSCIGAQWFGGVRGCPSEFFDTGNEACLPSMLTSDEPCRECWNREYRGEPLRGVL